MSAVFSEPLDFKGESEALYRLLEPLPDDAFRKRTLFKDWTIDQVLRHVHLWNLAADESAFAPEAFAKRKEGLLEAMGRGATLAQVETGWHDGASGRKLLEAWRAKVLGMAERWAHEDPKRRVAWAGPDMSLRSSITARLMETWAHGQEVYDALGVERENTDRIRGIAVLGVNTFGWTFRNRGLEPPAPPPHVRLTAPSGAVWTWNEASETNLVEGTATEFCQVVTQTRNVADTKIRAVGDVATRWMAIAQCFAGPPEDPPPPGARRRAS